MTKHEFKLHTIETAPAESRIQLEQVKRKFGRLPNFFAVAAESPAAVNAYLAVSKAFQNSGLTPQEQQLVILAASVENKCEYCVQAHSRGAKAAGLSDADIESIRRKVALTNPKTEALRRVVSQVVEKRGWLSEPDVQAFLGEGYTKSQLLDVLVGVSMKTLSNYINHIAEPPME